MTDLILKSFNGVAKQKSYGGKTLKENLDNAEKAIAKVQYTERIWDRSRSQYMLKYLTCSNADGWLRLRQISSEMSRKRSALSEAKFNYMKKKTKAKIKCDEMLEEENENKKLLLEIEAAEFESQANEILVKVEGALKECETLAQMHDQLKERLGTITEEAFEEAQVKGHIKRATMQAIRDVKHTGRISIGNAEYLEQSGLSTSAIQAEILLFIEKESKSGIGDTSMLHKFLDAIAEKYEGAAIQQAEWLGFDPHADKNLTYEP
jgi:methionine salvage enolase-phosphatase E1